MTVTITDGILYGEIRDDTGRTWPIVRHIQPAARGRMATDKPDLCMHTTETDGYVTTLAYPSQWQCGGGVIGQHIRLGYSGDAVFTFDNVLQAIEMVGRSKLAKWLPDEKTLGPTIALVAWLWRKGYINTGGARPNAAWPVVLDRGPQASTGYYRRNDGTFRKPGVYGHVEIPTNNHWDPGSFDYPTFFSRVRRAIDVQEMDPNDFAVGDRVFNQLRRAILYIRHRLKHNEIGEALTIRVIKESHP